MIGALPQLDVHCGDARALARAFTPTQPTVVITDPVVWVLNFRSVASCSETELFEVTTEVAP